jgi:integrase
LPPLDSFEATAREWFAVKRGGWAPSYADKIIARLEADVFPWIGQAPVAGITPPQLLEVLRRMESRGVVETAHRALENCSQVFRYAVATGALDQPGPRSEGRAQAPRSAKLPRHSLAPHTSAQSRQRAWKRCVNSYSKNTCCVYCTCRLRCRKGCLRKLMACIDPSNGAST